MATLTEAREAIYQKFATAWGSTTPFIFANEDYNPPSSNWARVSVAHSGATQSSLGAVGARKFSHNGTVLVQIFIPKNAGLAPLDSLLTKAKNIFEGSSIANTSIWFRDVVAKELGSDGFWFMGSVEAQFIYDEIR